MSDAVARGIYSRAMVLELCYHERPAATIFRVTLPTVSSTVPDYILFLLCPVLISPERFLIFLQLWRQQVVRWSKYTRLNDVTSQLTAVFTPTRFWKENRVSLFVALDDNDAGDQDADDNGDKEDVRSICIITGWRWVTDWLSHRLHEQQ